MYLLFDIGGTNMRFATSEGKKLDHVMMLPTPKDYRSALELFKKSAAGLSRGKVKKVIGSVPRFASDKLTFWHTNGTTEDLEKITGAKVTLKNDAEMAGLGEAVYGAGKDHDIIAYLTFSTGFGGAKIANKKIDPNYFGFEPKLQIAAYDPKKGTSTSISYYTTGRSLYNRFQQRAEKIRSKKTWTEVETWMKPAINNAAVFWSPECIVIGGAVGMNKNVSLPRLQKFLDKRFAQMPRQPIIKKAELGQLSGLYGALVLATQKNS